MPDGANFENEMIADAETPEEETAEMRDADFLAAINEAESLSYGSVEDSQLGTERAQAIDEYLGHPYGNEVDGRSQVVSRDIYDTIEWIKPSIMRIFTGGDEVAQFDPVGPEDEQAAQQESDYINYVIQRKNNWFTVCYEWFTDALMTKNAYALAYWDTRRQVESEKYRGLTDDQFMLMAQDEVIEIVQHSQYPMPVPQGMQPPVDPQTGQPMSPPMLHDVVIKRTKEYNGVKLCVIPPERTMVSESLGGMSVRDADFFEYWELKTISEIRKMGFDIADDVNDDWGEQDGQEDNARDQFNENFARRNSDINEPASRKVRLSTLWIKYDYDQDGIAECRMVIKVGNTILYNDESTGVQVACIVPTPLPHRHPGLSVRDMIADLQLIKTTIWRQTLDNLYLANNGRYGISDKVNLDDMLTSRPGGVVRVANGALPGQEIMPIVHPFVAGQSLEVLNYTDSIIEHRTGTNQSFTGVDPNALSKAHSGVAIAQLSSAAAQRVELIARVFAEGVKELFLIVHELCIKNHHHDAVVKLRNQWVTVNPSEWKRRLDLNISVGLGAGNKEQLMNNLMNILKEQKEGMAGGISTPEKIYNTEVELTKAAGFPNADKFWVKPPAGPMPQQPNPDMLKIQSQEKVAGMNAQRDIQIEQMKAQTLKEVEVIQQQNENHRTQMKLQADEQNAMRDHAMNMQTAGKPQAVVQMDTGQEFAQFVQQMEQQTMRQEQAMLQTAQMMQQAMQAIAQAVAVVAQASQPHDEIIVRDKSGRAIGKKAVQAGTLQ